MNKKITIIELLNKIAKEEKIPEYIKYFNRLKKKTDTMLVCKENIIYKLDQLEIKLNDIVTILDEENDGFEYIEEVNIHYPKVVNDISDLVEFVNMIKDDVGKLIRNQNKIIERLNKDDRN